MQKLIWHQTCSAMVSFILQCTFKIVNFRSKGVYAFLFTRLTSSRFMFVLLLSHFDILISSDSLIFLLLYLSLLDNFFEWNQMNWQWHFKQCFVAHKLSHFPFMLPCRCSIVVVITFFFVWSMCSALQFGKS